MAIKREIDCITRNSTNGPISHVGGLTVGGSRWHEDVQWVIDMIKDKDLEWEFVVIDASGNETHVHVTPDGQHITTHPDDSTLNNLENLRSCTANERNA